jgi:hypothetical protein
MAPSGPELLNLAFVPADARITLRPSVEIERDRFVDRREFESGELAEQHLRSVPLVVIINEMVQSEPVPQETNFTILVPMQPRRQLGNQGIRSIHEWLSADSRALPPVLLRDFARGPQILK